MDANDNGIIQLLQSILNKGGSQPMSEKIPGVGGTSTSPGNIPANPASPDIKTVLSSIISQTSAIPGADKPMPKKEYPNYGQPSAYREYQTSGGHSRAAMADIFGNVKEIIQTSEKNKDAKEARNLAIDIERLTLAMQNPEDPNNKLIIDDITHDQKRMKKIKEALNVNFMSDERDPVAKQAHSIAMKSIQEKMGQQQGQGQPQQQPSAMPGQGNVQQPPPQAQAQAPQQDPMAMLRRKLGMPTVASLSPELQALNSLKPEVLKMLFSTKDQELRSGVELQKILDNKENRNKFLDVVIAGQDKQLLGKVLNNLSGIKREEILAEARVKVANIQFSAAKYRVDNDPRLKGGYDKSVKELKGEFDSLERKRTDLLKQLAPAMKADSSVDSRALGTDYHDIVVKQKAILNKLHDLNMKLGTGQGDTSNNGVTNGNDNSGTNRDTNSDFGDNDANELIKSISSYENVVGTDQ